MFIVLVKKNSNKVISVWECSNIKVEDLDQEHPTIHFDDQDGPGSLRAIKPRLFIVDSCEFVNGQELTEQELQGLSINDIKEQLSTKTPEEKIEDLQSIIDRKDTQIKNMQQVLNMLIFR